LRGFDGKNMEKCGNPMKSYHFVDEFPRKTMSFLGKPMGFPSVFHIYVSCFAHFEWKNGGLW